MKIQTQEKFAKLDETKSAELQRILSGKLPDDFQKTGSASVGICGLSAI